MSRADRRRKPRVFVGPASIAGYYGNLTAGLRRLGVNATYVPYEDHPFAYASDAIASGGVIRWSRALRDRTPRRRLLAKTTFVLLNELVVYGAFVWYTIRYDVFIFGFGRSLLPRNRDLPLLRVLGKRTIVNVGHGTEMRPPYINGVFGTKDDSDAKWSIGICDRAHQMRSQMRRIESCADYIIGAPYSSTQFARRRQINFLTLGIPHVGPHRNPERSDARDAVRILHSPSNPQVKGTERIRTAIAGLKEKGYPIEYHELVGRPNEEVLSELDRCDFVVDQVYSDTPLAGFAVEAASFGKPAVVGGYKLRELERFLPDDMVPVSHTCAPDQLEASIERLIVDAVYREILGRRAQSFVVEKWARDAVAERYVAIIREQVPHDWFIDPQEVTYLHGVGLSQAEVQANIRRIVEQFGVTALQLHHRPALERSFLRFAGPAD